MGEPCAVDAKQVGAPTASKYITQIQNHNEELSSRRKTIEGVLAGKRVAKFCIISLVSIGVAELIVAILAGSVVTLANSLNSLSSAMISLILLIGLYMAYCPADRRFHFGYHKVESFAALIAAMGMVAMGYVLAYQSFQSLIYPSGNRWPVATIIVLSFAAATSYYNTFQMRTIAKKYNLSSFESCAKDSIKTGSVSLMSLICVLIATQSGFSLMDPIGSIIIAGYIFYVAYISLKRSSLILIDAWENPKVVEKIRRIIEENNNLKKIITVKSILLRPAGATGGYAEIHLGIDGSMPLTEVELLCVQIETSIRSGTNLVKRVSTIPHAVSRLNEKVSEIK